MINKHVLKMSVPGFDLWLEDIVKKFESLNSEEQTLTLNQLISSCGSEQLWHLQHKLPDFLYRDFVSLLPPEITEKILTYLPTTALLSACQVSKVWNDRLSSMDQLWQRKADYLGSRMDPSVDDWKKECVDALRVKHLLSGANAWLQEGLVNLVKPPGWFNALDYHKGYVAGGTGDSGVDEGTESVVIWCVSASRVDLSFPVSSSVSCIKLVHPHLVVCGHFNGTLSSYHVTAAGGVTPGQLVQRFRLHTAHVLSLDISLEQDLLVSGGSDCSIKIWKLSSGKLLRTLPNQSHWVLTVILSSPAVHRVPRFEGRSLLLTLTRDDIQLFSWFHQEPSLVSKETLLENPSEEDVAELRSPGLKDVNQPDIYIPLKSSVSEAELIQSFFFTPGLHFDGANISFVRQMPMFDTQNIGDADIVKLDANTGKIVQNVHVNQKIRKLLAIGKRFAVLLLPVVDNKYKNLAVVDLHRRSIVGGCTVPHSRASTPDFSQASMGDTRWLDGLSSDVTKGLVVCMALTDSSIQVVEWDVHKKEEEEDVGCDSHGRNMLFVPHSSSGKSGGQFSIW